MMSSLMKEDFEEVETDSENPHITELKKVQRDWKMELKPGWMIYLKLI